MIGRLKMVSTMFCIVFIPNIANSAGEVVRGTKMADDGSVIVQNTFAVVPHLEYEFGAFDYDSGVTAGNTNMGIAFGVTVGKDKNILDIYSRQSLTEDGEGADVSNYGINYARIITQDRGYFSISLEQQSLKESKNNDFWESDIIRIKPGIGVTWHESKKFHGVVGGGFFVGFGDYETRQPPSGIGRSVNAEGDMTTIGLFVQNKAAYSLTDKLSLTASIVGELEMSVKDPEIGGEDHMYSGFSIYARLGLQYQI
jgi:hypothetical protein